MSEQEELIAHARFVAALYDTAPDTHLFDSGLLRELADALESSERLRKADYDWMLAKVTEVAAERDAALASRDAVVSLYRDMGVEEFEWDRGQESLATVLTPTTETEDPQ